MGNGVGRGMFSWKEIPLNAIAVRRRAVGGARRRPSYNKEGNEENEIIYILAKGGLLIS